MKIDQNINIAILGLGYVGLPLAIEFGKKYNVIGYDININRINELINFNDRNGDIDKNFFIKSKKLIFSNDYIKLSKCNIFIVCVPTPIKKNKLPDLTPLKISCLTLSKIVKKNDIIIFESTVYPGLTEDFCAKLIEEKSQLIYNKDFFCGYSPERINPGDRKHTIKTIKKIVAGSNPKTTNIINKLYSSIIKAGTYVASSIIVAESAKVIENTQRDLNIALINELAIIFNKLNINTLEVLKAASTKWNFQNFTPGLVGGHCIGVDPYYLTYKAKQVGYNPKIILSGRNLNDKMHIYISTNLKLKMIQNKINLNKSKVLIMGFTFKDNCKDIRNTKVFDLYKEISKYSDTYVYDPLINKSEVDAFYDIKFISRMEKSFFDSIVIALKHDVFKKISIKKMKSYCKKNNIIYDLKGLFKSSQVDLTF